MASVSTIVTVQNGVIQIPKEFIADPRFSDAVKVKVVSVESATAPNPKADWRALQSMFAQPGLDTTEWKRQEREFELAHDERKFGTKRPSW